MKTFAIYCQELPERRTIAEKHFAARGLDVDWINGIHGETFGLLPSRPYNVDHPGAGHLTPISQVGLTLSHYVTWQVCLNVPGDEFMILEDDAHFDPDWQERLKLVMEDVPSDFDILLLGNCNTSDKPSTHICGDVYEVKYPFATHCYLLRKKAIPVLIEKCRDATVKIDILMIKEAYPLLKVFTVLPRLCDQRGAELAV